MKNKLNGILVILLLLTGPAAVASAQSSSTLSPTVEEIIAKNIRARGGYEALKAIKTLVYSKGTYHEGDFTGSGNALMAFMRPFFRVVGDPDNPKTSIKEGFDGSSWEWYADPGVVVRTVGAASGATRRGADFEGAFVDFKAKGNKVVLGKPTDIGGKPAYQLIVTTPDNFSRSYFFDAQSYLVIADRYSAPVHAFGDEVKTESRFSDFRPVAGVLFAFHGSEVNIADGKVLNEMQWGAVEANKELPKSWFSPPQYERNLLQKFLEDIYVQRTDATAVMWSYNLFRRTYPEINTEDGIEFIGYQMLKMGEKEPAVILLKANAADYPQSAAAAFSLARAYQTNGNNKQAAAEYRRTLKLNPNSKRAAEALKQLPKDRR